MKIYQSNLLANILVFALGLVFVISPTALTSASMQSNYSFYPELFLCFIYSTNFNRPRAINLYIVFLLLFFSDVLHMKPIGLLTALVLVSFIFLERFQKQIRKSSFYTHFFIFFVVQAKPHKKSSAGPSFLIPIASTVVWSVLKKSILPPHFSTNWSKASLIPYLSP